MMEDFIVPCLAAAVLPGRMLIMDNAPSHEAKKALEWYQTMLHEAGWALFSCQDTRHKQATVNATRAPPKCTLCTTPQALVESFSRPLEPVGHVGLERGQARDGRSSWPCHAQGGGCAGLGCCAFLPATWASAA